ncbi:MAG: C1 family peptidase [Acidobacteriota bacterium]|jgi:C1A family cysteine protease
MYEMYRKPTLSKTGRAVGTGWLPPLPDLRDYTAGHPDIEAMSRKLGIKEGKGAKKLKPAADLRKWCSKVEDQGDLGACTAHAAVGVVEYFENRAFGRHIEGSRLFVYKTTRNLMQVKGDSGAWIRNAMAALAVCGVPAEKYWPYTDAKSDFDREPTAFVYSVADNFEAASYFCHDPAGEQAKPEKILESVKRYLAGGIPSMFGFFGFPSFEEGDVKGSIPYPCPGEKSDWGHAVMAVGYKDDLKIKNKKCGKTTTGALLFRNSWGESWGDKGYGWLPYDYVLDHLARDFWSLLSMNWVDTDKFGL